MKELGSKSTYTYLLIESRSRTIAQANEAVQTVRHPKRPPLHLGLDTIRLRQCHVRGVHVTEPLLVQLNESKRAAGSYPSSPEADASKLVDGQQKPRLHLLHISR